MSVSVAEAEMSCYFVAIALPSINSTVVHSFFGGLNPPIWKPTHPFWDKSLLKKEFSKPPAPPTTHHANLPLP